MIVPLRLLFFQILSIKTTFKKNKLACFKERHLQTIRVVGEAIAMVDFRRVNILGRRDGLAMAHAYCSVILYFA